MISARKLVIAAATASGAVLLLASPAFAHVGIDPESAAPGSATSVVFTIEHGCSESPTTQVELQLPAGVTRVEPALVPGWEFTIAGNVITWTGGPQPDHEALNLTVGMTLPDTPGEVLLFPVVQTCEIGEIRWIQPPNPDGSEPEDPAPVLVLTESSASTTAAAGTTAGAATTAAAGTTAATENTAATSDSTVVVTIAEGTDDSEDDDSTPLVIGAVAVGILALVGAGIWFGVKKLNA